MKNTYSIKGMTCLGCKSKVEYLLNELDQVQKVTVDLEQHKAVIESQIEIDITALQNKLPDRYKITKQYVPSPKETVESNHMAEKSIWVQLFPLFLILGYITVASVFMNYQPWHTSEFMMDFMGLFYVVFGFFKLLDLKGFQNTFRMYDPAAKVVPIYGWVYPFIETLLGIQFLLRLKVEIAIWVTIVLLGITTVGVLKVILAKKTIQCACLGTALKLPMTKATVIENAIMITMAIYMLIMN